MLYAIIITENSLSILISFFGFHFILYQLCQHKESTLKKKKINDLIFIFLKAHTQRRMNEVLT